MKNCSSIYFKNLIGYPTKRKYLKFNVEQECIAEIVESIQLTDLIFYLKNTNNLCICSWSDWISWYITFFWLDDDLSCSTGYHNALPLEVHGAGYAQMQMVSNAKALRLVSSLTAFFSNTLLKFVYFFPTWYWTENSTRVCEATEYRHRATMSWNGSAFVYLVEEEILVLYRLQCRDHWFLLGDKRCRRHCFHARRSWCLAAQSVIF